MTMIKNDHQLDEYALGVAKDILSAAPKVECIPCIQPYFERAIRLKVAESDHVVYHAKAHSIYQNCDTTAGELHSSKTTAAPLNCNALASAIAYGELISRVNEQLTKLRENKNDV